MMPFARALAALTITTRSLAAAAAVAALVAAPVLAQDGHAKAPAKPAQVDGGAYDDVPADGGAHNPAKNAADQKAGGEKPAGAPAGEHDGKPAEKPAGGEPPEKHEGKPHEPEGTLHPSDASNPKDLHKGESEHDPHGYAHMSLRALLVQTFGFAILAYILGRYAVPPIRGILEERRIAIRDRFEGFAKRDLELADAKANAEYGLREVERNAASRLDGAAREGAELRDQLIVEGEQYAAKVKGRLAMEKELERQIHLLLLRNQMVDSSLRAAEQALRAGVDRPAHDSIVDTFLDDLENVKVQA